eukprot:Nitzschia sp. Nitz4//scaffold54_size114964//39252//41138//NITZ4_003845-RA/size114964-processed-gene-0.182-mRNA-1//-1//CDS//3329554333//4674//frame0
MDSDEYFGTLGGSLMKDLLADLQVEDGDFSLDQLERELATLDQEPSSFATQPLPSLDAASLVVNAQGLQPPPGTVAPGLSNQGSLDAWSLSLQNFTAMSLQDDFLAADSARKKQQGGSSGPPPGLLDNAEDYDVTEKVLVTPPPGLGSNSSKPPGIVAPSVPEAKPFPTTPDNSLAIEAQLPVSGVPVVAASPSVPAVIPVVPVVETPAPVAPTPVAPVQAMPPMGVPMPPPGAMAQGMVPPSMPMGVPPGTQVPPPMMVPQGVPQGPPPTAPVVMATPAVAGAPAWQAQPPSAGPPQANAVLKVYCNPHPNAPTIPATHLESKYMSARDVAYIVHSILKPVLAQGMTEDDYYIQFLRRLGGQANPTHPKPHKDMDEEMASRSNKTKQWASQKGVLGVVAKTNVARPRALIATPVTASTEQDSEQKQRATLWKARIYCDQAYQAFQVVVDTWRSVPPGVIPPELQKSLVKLLKCMGVTHVDKEYKVQQESLVLLTKLQKGRTLIARTLEKALLPPNAVQALLPPLFDVLLSLTKKEEKNKAEEMCNARVFMAMNAVIQNLATRSDTLLECLTVVLKYGTASLSTTSSMECVHTLLRKGGMVMGQEPSAEKREAWGNAENEFVTLLQTF